MQEDNFFVRMEPKDVKTFILVVFNPSILVVENILVIRGVPFGLLLNWCFDGVAFATVSVFARSRVR
jgi:hypothetical protein